MERVMTHYVGDECPGAHLTPRLRRFIATLEEIGYGEALVKVEEGQPTRVIEQKRNIPIPNN